MYINGIKIGSGYQLEVINDRIMVPADFFTISSLCRYNPHYPAMVL